jgi:C4-dicarboxylate transporter
MTQPPIFYAILGLIPSIQAVASLSAEVHILAASARPFAHDHMMVMVVMMHMVVQPHDLHHAFRLQWRAGHRHRERRRQRRERYGRSQHE